MNIEQRKKEFIKIFGLAEKHYAYDKKRLAAEGWKEHWQTLFATILSAQTRDETTIPIAEELFKKKTLDQIAKSLPLDIKKIIRSINYNNTKSEHLVQAAQLLVKNYNGKVPSKIEELLLIPGVGRKTANLILGEIYGKDTICVDTHVHRISNVFGFVKTLTSEETEKELMKIAPKKYWNKINRIFVLWGKEVPGYDKSKFLEKIK